MFLKDNRLSYISTGILIDLNLFKKRKTKKIRDDLTKPYGHLKIFERNSFMELQTYSHLLKYCSTPIQCRCRQGYGHSGRGLKFHKTISKKVHFQVFIFYENQVYK